VPLFTSFETVIFIMFPSHMLALVDTFFGWLKLLWLSLPNAEP